MNMTGVEWPLAINLACRSVPLMPGMCRSVITHDDSQTSPERKYSSAEENVVAEEPSDFMRLLVASRPDSSSSIIDITGAFANCYALTPWDPEFAHRRPLYIRK